MSLHLNILYYYIATGRRGGMDGQRHRFGAQGQWFPLSPRRRRQSIKDDNKPREDVGGQLVGAVDWESFRNRRTRVFLCLHHM